MLILYMILAFLLAFSITLASALAWAAGMPWPCTVIATALFLAAWWAMLVELYQGGRDGD